MTPKDIENAIAVLKELSEHYSGLAEEVESENWQDAESHWDISNAFSDAADYLLYELHTLTRG